MDTRDIDIDMSPEDIWRGPTDKPPEDTWRGPTDKPPEDTWRGPTDKPPEDTWRGPTDKPPEDTWRGPTDKPPEDTWRGPADIQVLGVPAKPIEEEDDLNVSGKDSKRCWVVCFAAFLIQVLIVGVLHVFGVFFVALIEEFNCTRAEAAWIGSVAYGLSMFVGPLASSLINRFGASIVTAMGALICSLSLVISSFMPNIPSLYASFGVLYGFGCCFAYSPTMTIAGDYFDKYLTIATGIMVAGSSTGTLILSPITQAMVNAFGWRNSFRVLAGMVLLGVWSAYMFKPLKSSPTQSSGSKMIKKSIAKPVVKELQLWKNKVFILWVSALTLAMFGYYVPYVHLVSHALDLGISSEKSSILLMLLGGSTATGRILFGKIVDFGFLNRLHMHQMSMVITGTACMMLPLITTFYGLVLYVMLVGLVDGCFVVLQPVLTSSLFGSENKVTAWGFLICMGSFTFSAGPPLAGWLYDKYGSYNIAFHVAGVPIVIASVMLLFIPWAQRTAASTNAMEVARNVYDTTLYQETIETPETRNELIEDTPLNLYAITSEESNKSDEPMLKRTLSDIDEVKKPYLVVDITEAVRKTVEEAMESYRNQVAELEEIREGPLSQLGTPAFKIGSLHDRGARSQRDISPPPPPQIPIKLAMSPMVVDSGVASSAPRVIYPGTSFQSRGGNVPRMAMSLKHPSTSRATPSSSMATSVQGSINDLRRRMMYVGHGGFSPSSAPRVAVPTRPGPSDIIMGTSLSLRGRRQSDSETQTDIDKAISKDKLPKASSTKRDDTQSDVKDNLREAVDKRRNANNLQSPASQPFLPCDEQQERRTESQEDSFVHIDLPTRSQQKSGQLSSSTDITPSNTPRRLGEAEPMFQMSDISLSEHKEQQPPPPKK